ncbi:MAG TPA: hypothetical protein VFZ09_37165 [Archangium sp.]|uniref:hypothetical protein n=1 Tax=Archangium sp. TaxID=1872627 RepID=UPI002E2EDBB3|nr:hypothetical protein [Archangium sp.]HEX5751911.1 hypothetical protein [Archangium sp.]
MSDSPAAGGTPSGAAIQGYDVPGRNPGSQTPWQFFFGNAAHRLIAYMYGVNHPGHQTYYNSSTLYSIIRDTRLGDSSRLLPNERPLRPDITDVTARHLFEIKLWHEQALEEGRQEVRTYLAALNRVVAPDMSFSAGTDFRGEVLIRFARGQYIWRLTWWVAEPGVVQYRWTRSQRRFESEVAAYEDGQWVTLIQEEMAQYGGWVGQAVEEMVERRERLATFSGAVGIVIEVLGNAATGFFSGAILGRMGSGPGAKQPPSQGGGQVIPFPSPSSPIAPPVRVPAAASGMPLPRG